MTETLLRASLQSGAALLVLAVLCRLFSRLPASTRCWLWRLGYLKCLAALALSATLLLPLLPAKRAISLPEATFPRSGVPFPASEASFPARESSSAAPQPAFPAPHRAFPSPQEVAPTQQASFPWGLLYCLGAGTAFLRLVITAGQTGVLLRSAKVVAVPAVETLAEHFRLRRTPRVARLAGFSSPLLAFGTILLPEPALADEELIVAHELAHVKRRDLFWEGLGALVGVLFWFHPLVWWARREEKLAREQAADALALAVTAAPRAEYARVLLTATLRQTPSLAIGAFASPSRLRRRLEVLAQPALPRRKVFAFLMLTSAFALPTLVPWRAVERPSVLPKVVPVAKKRTIVGVISNEQGHPVPGARLQIVFMTAAERPPLATTTSGPDGRFRFPEIDESSALAIIADAPGYGMGFIEVSVGMNYTALTLYPAGHWEVFVTDTKGRPMPNEPVSVPLFSGDRALFEYFPASFSGKTNAQGRLVINGVGVAKRYSPNSFVRLARVNDLRWAIAARGADRTGDTVTEHLILTPGRSIAGKLSTFDGQPLPGEKVFLTPVPAPTSVSQVMVRTDAQGNFRFEQLVPARYRLDTWTASLRAAAVVNTMLDVQKASISGRSVVLPAGVTVQGQVRDTRTGQPLAGVVLTATYDVVVNVPTGGSVTHTNTLGQITTDSQGRYTAHLPAEAACALTVATAPLRLQGPPPIVRLTGREGQRLQKDIVLKTTTPLTGVVRNPQGELVANAHVSWIMSETVATSWHSPETTVWRAAEAITDSQGTFSLAVPPSNRSAWLLVEARGWARSVTSLQKRIAAPLDIALQPEARRVVTFCDAAGKPVVGLPVWAKTLTTKATRFPMEWANLKTRTDAQGQFTITGVSKDDNLDLAFDHSDWCEDYHAAITPERMVLTPSHTLEGTLTRPDGEKVSWVEISVMGSGDTRSIFAHDSTDMNGHFRIIGLAPGTYYLNSRTDGTYDDYGLTFPVSQKFVVSATQKTTTTAIRLVPSARLIGTTLDRRGKPVPKTHVQSGVAATYSDAEGHYSLAVPMGTTEIYTNTGLRHTIPALLPKETQLVDLIVPTAGDH